MGETPNSSQIDQVDTVRRPSKNGGLDAFQTLVKALRDALEPSSGSDSSDVNPDQIQQIMAKYISKEEEWSYCALPDPGRAYTRNLVDEGNGRSNLLVLVWSPGRQSPVHDHANAHCIMKILRGSLIENLYEIPADIEPSPESHHRGTDRPLVVKRRRLYAENEVTYISDKIGLHKISNASSQEYAVSLHLYTPPYAAKFGFNIFDEKTRKRSHCKQAEFFSRYGQKSSACTLTLKTRESF